MEKNEELFYNKLKDIFIGAKIEGNSGFINLMNIKSNYFDVIFKELNKEINEKINGFSDFREEMFDKLYTFFNTYFSESGSIYFTYTPLKSNIYDKIYTNQDDVILFWKTRMLYYVKTDKLWSNLSIDYDKDGLKYKVSFDSSKLEHKSGNEKKHIKYELKEIKDKDKDKDINFYVKYSENGNITKTSEIIKEFKKNKIYLDEDDLDKIFKIFEKQNEVDYFINKNAKEFLREQFDLWLKNYIFDDESDFSEKRIKELKALKEIAFTIIDFVSQFEDELVKIWNKPKFILNSNYVITLDRIAKQNDGISIIEKILSHKDIDRQIEEWKNLGIVDNKFDKSKVLENKQLNTNHEHLPIDTKYFKDLELEILELFDDLDESLDGWLIHSENYQALNTILSKFKEKVQTVYIDPPFNTGTNEFLYKNNYIDSSWISMMYDRVEMGKKLLKSDGSFFVRIDYHGNQYVRMLMDSVFGNDKYRNEIVVNRTIRLKSEGKKFYTATDSIFFYVKNDKYYFEDVRLEEPWNISIKLGEVSNKDDIIKKFSEILVDCDLKIVRNRLLLRNQNWVEMHASSEKLVNPPRVFFGKEIPPPRKRRWMWNQEAIDKMIAKGWIRINQKNGLPEMLRTWRHVSSDWLDIKGYAQSWDFPTENAEELIQRILKASSKKEDWILDYFLGSGTTAAVAHKLNRKWIGVEMGDYFDNIPLKRMKTVLAGEQSGISNEVDWKGGGFFKYYDLEQYEQTLRKCHYIPSEPFFNLNDESIYEQYIFM
ncbi:MAG: site-specific DNA-methyltransferase, partial [Ferroplasma sp.]